MRDRLIELCGYAIESCKSSLCADCEHNNIDYPNCMGVHFADYLLENGVIVPPCKVGDTVYETDGVRIYESTIDEVTYYTNNVIYYTSGVAFDETAIGHSVFLTREEAERALKGEKQ